MVMGLQNVSELHCRDFLGLEHACECGRLHSISIEEVLIENGAIKKVPQLLKKFGYKKAFIMADANTYSAAGKAVEAVLQEQIDYQTLIFQRAADLVPDERAIGEFFLSFTPDADVIIAVGSGVLNDLAKYVSRKVHIPYIIVATAPSMDGFASDGAALIIDNVKTSYPMANAKAIIGDTDVLKQAPMNMIASGLGDMLGKYSALRDWKLANIIEQEYYCGTVEAMVKTAVRRCLDSIEGLRRREDQAVNNLMEGLVLTGIAMSFAGSSRPASGSEHHLSHFWEMMYLLEGKAAVLHGTKVGIATLLISRLSELLASQPVDLTECEKKANFFDQEDWRNSITRVYQKAAPGILKLAETANRNSLEAKMNRIAIMKENWPSIIRVLREGPSSQQIENWLRQVGAPVRPSEIGIGSELLYNGLLYAKEVRIRYTILQLLGDIGVLQGFAALSRDRFL